MRLLLLSSHAILEYDDVRMFHDLGVDVFAPGGYSDPAHPGEAIRPALPQVPYHADLAALCQAQRVKHEGQSAEFGIVDWAKADLHPDLIDWADVIMVNCFPEAWIGGQWDAIKHKRVIWRTIGQSSPHLEHEMMPFRRLGMEVVRYSPAERRTFEPRGTWAGEDAVIRFAKYPADFAPWIGDNRVVGNVTQNLDIRGDHCGLDFWLAATKGLPVQLAGMGSERLGGLGLLSTSGMYDYLRHLRAACFMGTQPASYTLSLMELMLAGVPTVSIGPREMWLPELFEGHELIRHWSNEPVIARGELAWLLGDDATANEMSGEMRERGIALFGVERIGAQWAAYLGAPVRQAVLA